MRQTRTQHEREETNKYVFKNMSEEEEVELSTLLGDSTGWEKDRI